MTSSPLFSVAMNTVRPSVMMSFTIEAFYAEGNREKAEGYMANIPDSPFKRDVLAISGFNRLENGS